MEGKSDDFKDIFSLSTTLVSKIQEAKDGVSEIELDFCQLFPKFELISKSFQRTQEEWQKRETNLLSQKGELKLESTQERDKLLKSIWKIQNHPGDHTDFDEISPIEKLEDSERAVEEKKVKPHSSKRSHEDLDEINTEEISPIEMARKSKPDISSTTSARGAPVPRETCRDKLAVEEPTWEEKLVKRQRSQPVARQKPEQTSTPDVVEDEGLREVEPDAKRAVELAIRLCTRAQFLKEKAELATYRATKARRISNALFRRSQTAAPDS